MVEWRADPGSRLPITVMLRDNGDTATMLLSARGRAVKMSSPELWANDTTMKVTPTIPEAYSMILSGNGEATFSLADKQWTAVGSGTGTLLAIYS